MIGWRQAEYSENGTMLNAEMESRLDRKYLRAMFITCAVGGVALLWSGHESEAPKNDDNVNTFDEVVSRAVFSDDTAVQTGSDRDLAEITIVGRVVDSEGIGIANATVAVKNTAGEFVSISTQGDGRFVLGPFAAVNPVEIEISADGFIPAKGPIEVDDTDVRVTLLRTGRLEGTATDSQSNESVAEFTVSLFADNKIRFSNTPDASGIYQEPSGFFEIIDLKHQQMDLFARADGYQPVILGDLAISDQTKVVELKFDKARSIYGRVVSAKSGEAISGGEVYVQESRLQLEHRRRFSYPGETTNTSENGTFLLDELSRGIVKLTIRANGYQPKSVVFGPFDEGGVEVLLAPAGSVAGHLVGNDGVSPEVGGIRLVGPGNSTLRSSRSGVDGRFIFKNLPAGGYVLSARSSAGQSNQIKLSVGDGEHVDDLQLQILWGNELTGRVRGLMPGETALGVAAHRPGRAAIAKSVDTYGYYSLKGLQTGTINIVAKTSEGRSLLRSIDFQATTVAYLDFIFDGTASIHGRISRGGVPVGKMYVSLIPLNRDHPRGDTYTTEDGRYSIEGLADSKYVFSLNGEGNRYLTLNGRTQHDVDL